MIMNMNMIMIMIMIIIIILIMIITRPQDFSATPASVPWVVPLFADARIFRQPILRFANIKVAKLRRFALSLAARRWQRFQGKMADNDG